MAASWNSASASLWAPEVRSNRSQALRPAAGPEITRCAVQEITRCAVQEITRCAVQEITR